MRLLKQKKIRRVTAAIVCAAMLVPVLVRGVTLDGFYAEKRIADTWNLPQEELHDQELILEETGLACNVTPFQKDSNVEHIFPFDNALYFTARPGYIRDKFKPFDGRFFYCVDSHTQGYRLDAGMQMFFRKEYGIKHPNKIFGATIHGENENENNFNFLMTAIACGYPGIEYDPEKQSTVAYYLVCQSIAWVATDEGSRGFKGAGPEADNDAVKAAFLADLEYYRSQPEYKMLEQSFPEKVAPEIYNRLHTAASGNLEADFGLKNFIEETFFYIWRAAYLTMPLEQDWDKELSAAVTTAREEDGIYYADINLFVNEIAREYLNGIAFKPYGDWSRSGQDEDGTMHFSSPTGETDENGCIGYLYWPNGTIGSLCPIDQTKAKLYTFEGYTDTITDNRPGFGKTQVYFSSVIDQNLNLYIRIGDNEEGDFGNSCVRHEHKETFHASYNLNLLKYDSETGKPLAGSHWDILEKFDDTQLGNTDLDREPDNPGSYQTGLGNLKSTKWGNDDILSNYSGNMGVTKSDTNRYNWGNDSGTQFERWDDPHDDPCTRDDNVTGEDGLLYEIDSSGNISSDRAHTDVKLYTYYKGYCDGHPAPEIEYIECDHDGEEDCDCEEINQELHDEAWEEWYAEVQKCERLVEEGGFFHCIEPGEAAKKAMEEDRDQFFQDFISLTYEYSARETKAAKGYILHGRHTDDIPIEWRVVTSSEYKDTGEARNLEHKSSQSQAGQPENVSEQEDGDSRSLWASAREAMRASLEDASWVSKSVKEENAGDGETVGTQEATEPKETAEPKESTESKETAKTQETTETQGTTEPKGVGETQGATESKEPVETQGSAETLEDKKSVESTEAIESTKATEATETAESTKATESAKPQETAANQAQKGDGVDAEGTGTARDEEPAGITKSIEANIKEAAGENRVSISEKETALTKTSLGKEPDEAEEGRESLSVTGETEEAGIPESAALANDTKKTAVGSEDLKEPEETEDPKNTKNPEESQTGAADGESITGSTEPEPETATPLASTKDSQEAATKESQDEEEFLADLDLLVGGGSGAYATDSDAEETAWRPEHAIRQTGFWGSHGEADGEVRESVFSRLRKDKRQAEETGRAASFLRKSERFQPTQADFVKPPQGDIVDWTFVVYDHRTEGEIHFNKRDFDLQHNTGDTFGDYAAENGDGTLEGAVYGLFAAQDIIHPDTDGDGDTGVVFQKDDLVSIATTDRNGDASFMVITEAPGSVYNYDTGSIEHTDWYGEAPANLHMERDASAAKEQDIEGFTGHNPDGSVISAGDGTGLPDTRDGNGTVHYKKSTNQKYDSGLLYGNRVTNNKADTYREEETTGRYPILDNEGNNGNCWIGRPLILGKEGSSYYIKELSRSEGYELSVYGKDGAAITNREAFGAGGGEFTSGEAHAGSISRDTLYGGNTFRIESSGTQGGYILKAANIPEGAVFYTTVLESHWDDGVSHQEPRYGTEPVYAPEGVQVTVGGKTWEAALGDTITYHGKTFRVNNTMTVPQGTRTVKPDNRSRVESPFLDVAKITPTANVMGDINTLFSKSGFRKVADGCPWVGIPISSFNTQTAAAAINATLFTDDWYSVFNAFEMLGTYIQDGTIYAVIGYCYRDARVNSAIYNPDNQSVYVKTGVSYTVSGSSLPGFAYRSYDMSQCGDVQRNGNGFVVSATVPNETVTGSPEYAKEPMEGKLTFAAVPDYTVWTYAAGEPLLDQEGDPVLKQVVTYEDVTPTYVTEAVDREIAGVSFQAAKDGNGTYTMTVPQEWIDEAGGKLDFRILYNNAESNTVSSKEYYAHSQGVIGVTFPIGSADSYIEPLFLMYPGDREILQDGGTIAAPARVYERPIRQKVRVEKDIQTLKETKRVWYCLNCGYENLDGDAACGFCDRARSTEETRSIDYANDTYAAFHSDNISAERDGGWYQTAKDWLGSLLQGNSPEEEPESIGNFRFKAYLKSNLERLYRDEDGHIVWMDRNGNTMTPQYGDTNGDGNYDTFTWKYDEAYGGKTVDFPEKDKVSGGDAGEGTGAGTIAENAVLLSSNVQKIYTDVEHREGSMTTSARANNVWDTYADPQKGKRENAGQIEGYTTSEREVRAEGDAVKTNASLYSYDGIARDKDRSDYLQDEQNHGYTRLLETQRIQAGDGEGPINHEAYNYEKFFDAIQAANTDIWDNDMHSTFTGSSMSNYPGQHWFETFYEKYQPDDGDRDYTLANIDGQDKDGTAGGDRDTSFKPFRWIREQVSGDREGYTQYPAVNNGKNKEVVANTSDQARANANASDAVRQFAVKWYLEDEAAKLMADNGRGENIARPDGKIGYDEAVYDLALFEAIAKAYNYLRPFYYYDLDTIYSVEWDSAAGGGADKDYTTLSADERLDGRYYNVSSYLPYGVYVIVEQPPQRRDDAVNDWENRSYGIEKPKEVIVPSVYDGPESNDTTDNYDTHYNFNAAMSLTEQAKESGYLIRFGEEDSGNTSAQDSREFVIRAHGYHGDFEVCKYGLDIDRLQASIQAPNGEYRYGGWDITQEVHDPLKDYYGTDHRGEEGVEEIRKENGGSGASRYHGFDAEATANGNRAETANGSSYDGEALRKRFFYASLSEDDGVAGQASSQDGEGEETDIPGMSLHNGVKSTTGELTAYNGKYSAALVPWTMTAPADSHVYSAEEFSGYADVNERNHFYAAYLRINKTDSETGEYIVHDDAIFGLYAASRYNTFGEIEQDSKLIEDPDERARFLFQFKPGDAKFYLQDTEIMGSREFLEAMKARDITPFKRRTALNESMEAPGHLCSGIVPKGTPVCIESERVSLYDGEGKRTGQMTAWTTRADVEMADPEGQGGPEYGGQNVGYFKTSQPIGAGVYVLAELKPPLGYVRSKPVAIEVYSDKTTYYADGDMYAKVDAVRYD